MRGALGTISISITAHWSLVSVIDCPRMILFLLFLCLNGAFATQYSVFEHQNISTLLPENNCRPLYYGDNCTIPYCCPETSHLVQRSDNDFYCNCTAYTTGTHCEIVECHRGKFSRFSHKCECEFGIFGDHCEREVIKYVIFGMLALAFVGLICTVYHDKEDDDESGCGGHSGTRSSQNRVYWTRAPQPPAPEIRVVERVVIQERSEAPPTYDSAVRSADPPKYTV